ETVYFTFDKVPVGETTVYKVEPPGQSACGETGKYGDHWKLLFLPSELKKYASCGQPSCAIIRTGGFPMTTQTQEPEASDLFFQAENSDKEYHLQLTQDEDENGWMVTA